jgi:ADP-heptose:LPS heptosyltransferase
MHITFTEEELQYGQKRLDDFNTNRPKVVVCPTSAMMGKNLIGVQLTGVLTGLRDMGLFPIGLHTRSIPEVEGCRMPMIQNISIRQWMSIINAANYVIAVDTAAFHLAGGLNKPLVGVFSFADGKVYGKYFDFELVQKHRDNGDWTCGPCYNWTLCPKSKESRKPCITEIASKDILNAFERLLEKYPLKDD